MAGIVVALDTLNVSFAGQRWHILRGSAWAADDPLVRAYPTCFAADDRTVYRSSDRVEQATAAPGEKRSTPRRRSV